MTTAYYLNLIDQCKIDHLLDYITYEALARLPKESGDFQNYNLILKIYITSVSSPTPKFNNFELREENLESYV